jgi:hypothetical protein
MKKLRKLIIDRRRWTRGTGGEGAALYNTDNGGMCCLGFAARQLGKRIKVEEIQDSQLPRSLMQDVLDRLPVFMQHVSLMDDFADLNDRRDLDSKEREEKLKIMFREQGVSVRFVGRSKGPKVEEEVEE